MRVKLSERGKAGAKIHSLPLPRPQRLVNGDIILVIATPDGSATVTLTHAEAAELSLYLRPVGG